jgi:hypothetical protein
MWISYGQYKKPPTPPTSPTGDKPTPPGPAINSSDREIQRIEAMNRVESMLIAITTKPLNLYDTKVNIVL